MQLAQQSCQYLQDALDVTLAQLTSQQVQCMLLFATQLI